MALYDKARNWWDNLDIGNDLLGVGLSDKDQLMLDGGLLKKEDIKRAKEKSLTQGLLSAGLAYAIQPKNKGYGSAIPYLAQAAKVGLTGARAPYEGLGETAKVREQIRQYGLKKKMEEDRKKLFVTPSPLTTTKTIMSPAVDDRLVGSSGVQLAPSYKMLPQDKLDSVTGRPITETTVFPERLDMEALSRFGVKYPGEAKPIYDNFKTQAEIGRINYEVENPENFRPATREEILAFGSDPEKGGQVNTKTGKFIPGSSPLVNVDLSKKSKEIELEKAITYFNKIQQNINTGIEGAQELSVATMLIEQSGNMQGFGSNALASIDKIAKKLGIDIPGTSQADYLRALKTSQIKLALGQKKPGSGPMTDKDFENYLDTTVQTTNPKGTNEIIAYIAQAKQAMQEEFADAFEREILENGYGVNVYSFERKYFRDKKASYISNIKSNIDKIVDRNRSPEADSGVIDIINTDLTNDDSPT